VGSTDGAREFNEGIRESAEIVANVDKGFMHYLKYFRNDLEVTAPIRIESGTHGEYGGGVYFEQSRHRCILAGTVVGSDDDATWTACAECANFEPVLGQAKIHVEKLWTPGEFTHVFEDLERGLAQSQSYQAAIPYRKLQIERFSAGVAKFGQAFKWHAYGKGDAPVRADTYSYHAAASRPFRVSDGPDLWNQGPVKFAPPASDEMLGTFPKLANSTWLVQFGGRVFGGPGEVGTGSSVSAPDWDRDNVLTFSGGFWLRNLLRLGSYNLWLEQGRNQDLRVRLHALPPPGGE
jgi:hypothetical protein